MRLFIGIDLPENFKDDLKKSYEVIKDACESYSLSNIENSHVTFCFLGEVEEDKIEIIKNSIDSSFDKIINVSIEGFMKFDSKYGDIVCRKIVLDNEVVNQVVNMRKKLNECGFFCDKSAFKPHMTISRDTIFKEGKSLDLLPFNKINFQVKSVFLYLSHYPSHTSRKYDKLYEKVLS